MDVMTENKAVPQLRFGEFKQDWKIEPIGNFINLLSGYAFKGDDISDDNKGIPLLRGINITEGHIRHNVKIDRYFTGDTSKMEKLLLKVDDLVLGMDGSKVGKNVALITEKDKDSLLIQRVARLRVNHQSDIRYIYQQVFSNKFHKYVYVVNTSSGIPHISAKQIKEFKIGFPSLPEQQKIASFLSAVDEKLQQLTKKKDLLEEYKKGVMQQIFSQELRFKDTNGNNYPDWEEKKLGEVCNIKMGQSPDSKSYNLRGEGMLLIQGNADICNRQSNPRKWTSSPTKQCEIGDLILTVRAPVGGISKSQHKACIGRGVCSISNNNDSSIEYLYQFLLDYEDRWGKLEQGSTFTAVSGKDIREIKLNIPNLEEQQRIANFLSSLDSKIDLVSTQIENTKAFKKGLLQQMFV